MNYSHLFEMEHQMIWKKTFPLSQLNQFCQNSAVSHLGIEFTELGEDYLEAKVPVDQRTVQPFGLLHGGVSAALAETLGSAAALLCAEEQQNVVGTELNISHLKAIKQDYALGRATPLHLGKHSQVWNIHIFDSSNRLCAAARLAVRLLDKAL